jgi:hypothetical protein
LPPQRLYLETIRRAKHITKDVVKELNITGPFNIQFIGKDNDLKVIECNLRASRSFPFVSKVTHHNFIEIATEAMMGINKNIRYQTLEKDYVGVKSPQFSYNRLKGADPVAGVEMASTGEVACLGGNLLEAFYTSWHATEQTVKGKKVFISIADEHKHKITNVAKRLKNAEWEIYATVGTYEFLKQNDVPSKLLHKIQENIEPSVSSAVLNHQVNLMINIPASVEKSPDAYKIRRLAIDNHVPIITNIEIGKTLLKALLEMENDMVDPKSWQEFMEMND